MGKKSSHSSSKPSPPVVLDTITTRFLMLFIIVLAIPLFSLIIFTNSILKNDIDNTVQTVLSSRTRFFKAKLLEEQHAYGRILHHFSTLKEQKLKHLCATSSQEICFLIDFKAEKVSSPEGSALSLETLFQETPDFKTLSQLKSREKAFYGLWQDQLFLFNAYRPDSTPEQWYVLGFPVDEALLSEYYMENPTFRTGLWIISERPDAERVYWQARGSGETSHFSEKIEEKLLEGLKKQDLNLPQVVIKTDEESFQVQSYFIYNINNEKIARVITLLPLGLKDEIIATYSFGLYFIVIASLLFSITVAILTSRSITQPMLKLVKQVTSLGQTGDFSERVTVKGVHEINALGQAFNKMLNKLEQEHQTKDDFVATLTHDLKVPLLSERQTLQYLEQGTYGALEGEQNEVIQVLQSSNQSNLDLVNGILEIYRYESGQIKLVPEAIAIEPLFKMTLDELRPLFREKQIKISFDNSTLAKEQALVWADRIEIKRVLTNLISNAITNTPKHGTIACCLTDPSVWGSEYLYKVSDFKYTSLQRPEFIKDRLVITIRDSGIGFSTEDLPRLFKQFAANRGRNPMSIGLGLYNCYQVLREHRGSIWIETTEGEGSAVTILLPVHSQTFEDRRKAGDRRNN